MNRELYRYNFDSKVPIRDVEDSLLLAVLAVESLYGRSRVRMESRFRLDKTRRICVIDASTDVGSDLARIFTGFTTKEYGERSVLIERTQPLSVCDRPFRCARRCFTGVAVRSRPRATMI